jgi:hypothetical protein
MTERATETQKGTPAEAGPESGGMKPVQFVASFPTGGQPIKIGADTMTILLEIPRTELLNGLELIAMQEMALMITVRPLTKAEFRNRRAKEAADAA